MSDRNEIVGVQYLRGFAAIAVVLAHAAGMVAFPKYYGKVAFGDALFAGTYGIDIFFVISGFIIAIVSLKGPSWTPVVSRREFLARRAARILPLLWIAVIVFVVLRWAATDTPIVPINYVRALLLFPHGRVEPLHIWTLRHELAFYLVFALSFLGAPRLRWLLALWLGVSIAIALTIGHISNHTLGGVLFGRFNIEFGCGLLIGLAWVRRPWSASWRWPVHPFVVLAGATAATLAVAMMSGNTILRVFAIGGLTAGLVALATRVGCPDDWLSRLGRLLGDASYSIYLFHPHFLAALLVAGARFAPGVPPELVVVIVAGAATIAGVVIHLTIERPLVRAAQRLLLGRSHGLFARAETA